MLYIGTIPLNKDILIFIYYIIFTELEIWKMWKTNLYPSAILFDNYHYAWLIALQPRPTKLQNMFFMELHSVKYYNNILLIIIIIIIIYWCVLVIIFRSQRKYLVQTAPRGFLSKGPEWRTRRSTTRRCPRCKYLFTVSRET